MADPTTWKIQREHGAPVIYSSHWQSKMTKPTARKWRGQAKATKANSTVSMARQCNGQAQVTQVNFFRSEFEVWQRHAKCKLAFHFPISIVFRQEVVQVFIVG